MAPVFAALGDPNREMLLTLLARGGHASASALAPSMSVSRQAVDKHLRVLERVGLVESTRSGREVLYSVRSAQLDRSAAWLTELAANWDNRLSVIKRMAEAPDIAEAPDVAEAPDIAEAPDVAEAPDIAEAPDEEVPGD